MEDMDTVIEKKSDTELQEPPMYAVIYHNDDFTTFDFVVQTLQEFFHKSHDEAIIITQKVHKEGRACAEVTTRDIAETKIAIVTTLAQSEGFPLKLTMERDS